MVFTAEIIVFCYHFLSKNHQVSEGWSWLFHQKFIEHLSQVKIAIKFEFWCKLCEKFKLLPEFSYFVDHCECRFGQLTCRGVVRGERIETNLQTTVKKKKYPGKKYGGAPPYFVEHKYLWGGPLFF